MINIINKEDCVGCNACEQICPKQCISSHPDEQGFLYPTVDLQKCIDCHLCEKVCPVINQAEPQAPIAVYAAKNLDNEIRMSSSSGGVFYALAKCIIEEGGVVFGAKFNDNWEVVHDYAETLDGIRLFQGSKYVQSKIGNTFRQAEAFLKAGRKVMFTGTPCQLAGLRLFLRKDYGDQLLKVDVVCHGVPSPMVWNDYLKYIRTQVGKNSADDMPVITGISFRDKKISWEKFGISCYVALKGDKNTASPAKHLFKYHQDNPYFWGFNGDLLLRQSCFNCPSKSGKSHSDITIGDFWHINSIHPTLDTEKGVSMVLIRNQRIKKILSDLNIFTISTSYSDAISCVPSIERSETIPSRYNEFWTMYRNKGIDVLIIFFNKYRFTKIQKYFKNPLKKILGERILKLIRKIRNI